MGAKAPLTVTVNRPDFRGDSKPWETGAMTIQEVTATQTGTARTPSPPPFSGTAPNACRHLSRRHGISADVKCFKASGRHASLFCRGGRAGAA